MSGIVLLTVLNRGIEMDRPMHGKMGEMYRPEMMIQKPDEVNQILSDLQSYEFEELLGFLDKYDRMPKFYGKEAFISTLRDEVQARKRLNRDKEKIEAKMRMEHGLRRKLLEEDNYATEAKATKRTRKSPKATVDGTTESIS